MAEALCEWGLAGIEALHARVGVLIIVDVLSFSTAVEIAVARGASVYPFAFDDERGAQAAALRLSAVLARPRRAAAGGFSLSPASLTGIASGTKLMLPSPNGSRLSVAAGNTPKRLPVMTGCLRNASAVGRWLANERSE
jgi:2-phosphosulfolactate phosphatase